jgi:TRAP-type mannitol/chloroaromatic compound transport system substrate-binding protein
MALIIWYDVNTSQFNTAFLLIGEVGVRRDIKFNINRAASFFYFFTCITPALALYLLMNYNSIKEVYMDRKELESLVVKKSVKKDKVMTVKVNQAAYDKLKKKGVDVAKTLQNWLERLAE